MSDVNVAKLLFKGLTVLGESPHWCQRRKRLFFIDMPAKKAFCYDPATGDLKSTLVKSDNPMASGLTFIVPVQDSDKDFIVGLRRAVGRLRWDPTVEDGGEVTVLHTTDDVPSYINDAKVDANGRVWYGTLNPDWDKPDPKKIGGLYRLDGGRPREMAKGAVLANGIEFTADGKTLFYADTGLKKVHAFDYNVEDGSVSNCRTVFDLSAHNIGGMPDGMTVDEGGKLWVAVLKASCVLEVEPSLGGGSGKILGSIKFPALKCVTSCCFGGDDLGDLYVTTTKLLSGDEPGENAGSVFVVKNVSSHDGGRKVRGVKGVQVRPDVAAL